MREAYLRCVYGEGWNSGFRSVNLIVSGIVARESSYFVGAEEIIDGQPYEGFERVGLVRVGVESINGGEAIVNMNSAAHNSLFGERTHRRSVPIGDLVEPEDVI